MKKIFIIALVLCTSLIASAQVHPTGLTEMTPEVAKVYSNIKRVNIRENAMMPRAGVAPITYVDNSATKFFPPVFNQIGNSCAYASGIGYIYNYEYNALNNLDGKNPENILNYLQVYAFINGGKDSGGHAHQGWNFARINGVTSKKDGETNHWREWYSGYEAYYNGMEKGVVDYTKFTSDVGGDILKMKQYLLNKGGKATYGGLIQFSAWAHPLEPSLYKGTHHENCDAMIHHFGNSGMHSMTIVGFDDEVGFDYDENGTIEGAEMGSFICCNSWGTSWGSRSGCKTNKGRFYAPYYAFSTLKQSAKNVKYTAVNKGGGTGNGGKECLVLSVKNAKRTLVAKIKMSHSSRNDIELTFGVSNILGATKPEHTFTSQFMKHQGGDYTMVSGNSIKYNEIEFGVNISEFAKYLDNENTTFFVMVKNSPVGIAGSGELISCSIIDCRGETPVEYSSYVDSYKLSGYKIARAITKAGYPKLEVGDVINVLCSVDAENKKIALNFNAAVDTPVQVDIIKSGEVVKNLYTKTIKKGKSIEVSDLSSLIGISYTVRIVAGNRFIYNNFKLK
ncbi:MAG: hypothetical protein WBG43_03595 [Marinifilaceae bacterium]